MRKPDIYVVINYCGNDRKFLLPCIQQVKKFTQHFSVVCFDHMFDGVPENMDDLKRDASNVMSSSGTFHILKWDANRPPRYHHNVARWFGYQHSQHQDYDWIMFLDVDEIIEGDKFNNFLIDINIEENFGIKTDVIKLANYWYFLETGNRWTNFGHSVEIPIFEDSVVMIKKSTNYLLSLDVFFTEMEREAFAYYSNYVQRKITYMGEALVHHYSWVRTKDEMLRKVKSWGHNKDKNWEILVEEQFKPENLEPQIKDVIFGKSYKKVEPFIKY